MYFLNHLLPLVFEHYHYYYYYYYYYYCTHNANNVENYEYQ